MELLSYYKLSNEDLAYRVKRHLVLLLSVPASGRSDQAAEIFERAVTHDASKLVPSLLVRSDEPLEFAPAVFFCPCWNFKFIGW
jgi:hypothetical protein